MVGVRRWGAGEERVRSATLAEAGFEEVAVEVTHTYPPEQIAGVFGEDAEALREVHAASAFVRARKPEAPQPWRDGNYQSFGRVVSPSPKL